MIVRIYIFLVLLITFISNCYPKEISKLNKIREEIPYYPNSTRYKLDNILNHPIDGVIVNDDFYKVINFYYQNMTKRGWKLVFPNKLEYDLWLEALNNDKSKNLVILLIFSKDKYNCNVFLSSLDESRYYKSTIVSIYINMIK